MIHKLVEGANMARPYIRLFITEKPELGRAIARNLGGAVSSKKSYIEVTKQDDQLDIITWCFGHMLSLYDPEDYNQSYKKWNFNDLPLFFMPYQKKPNEKSSDQLKVIGSLLKKCDEVIHGGDVDDEGQLLIDEVLRYFNVKKPVKRILFNANTDKVVKRALADLKPNSDFEFMGWRAEARSVADQLFGYNLSRGYTLNAQQQGADDTITLGRVQTPILGLIVRRDRENASHIKSHYFNVKAKFLIQDKLFEGVFIPTESQQVNDSNKLIDNNEANSIAQNCSLQPVAIESLNTKSKSEQPPLPYNLLKLQKDAARKFGYSLQQTLDITQSLRDNHGLITYNRSDCQYLSDEHFEEAQDVLNAVAQTASILQGAIAKSDPTIKSRAFNSEKLSAHHGIIPTDTVGDLSKLTDSEQKVYLLIARAYIAQFHPKYTYDSTEIISNVNGFKFKTVAKTETDLGWKNLYKNDVGNAELQEDEDTQSLDLRTLNVGDKGSCTECQVTAHETQPPALYTIGTLAEDLSRAAKYVRNAQLRKILQDRDKDKEGEHGGIGTSATRAGIVDNLISRGFITKKGNNIISTPLGQSLYDCLDDILKYPDMTAIWAARQEHIKNQDDVILFVKKMMLELIIPEINRLKTEKINILVETMTCKKCGRPMRKITTAKGKFWGCTGFNDEAKPCKATIEYKTMKKSKK